MRWFSVGTVLSRAFSTFWANFIPFTLLAGLIQLPTILAQGWMLQASKEIERLGESVRPDDLQDFAAPMGLVMLCQLLLTPLSTAAVTFGVLQQLRGRHATFGDCISAGFSRMFAVLGVGIVAGIAIAGGSLLCCVPGIILMCGYYVAAPVAVVENGGVMDSLRRSWWLTDGAKGTVFGILVCVGLGSGVLGNIVAFPFKGSDSAGALAAHFFLAGIVLAVTSAFGATCAAIAYHDLRLEKEGASSESLAHVFD